MLLDGRKLKWDAASETILNDEEATRMRSPGPFGRPGNWLD